MAKVKAMTHTTNGMAAHASTQDALVDMFFAIGAMRGKNPTVLFDRAYAADPVLATKIALWVRDVRGGAGERQLFRDILVHMEKNYPSMLERIIRHVPTFGRWDDLLVFNTDAFKAQAYTFIGEALRQGDGLCAKWMPRKGKIAIEIRDFFGMTPKQYRKGLVALTNVVETAMCAKDFANIEFGKLPSLASSRYQKAFARNAPAEYEKYKAALVAGTAKVNAAALYPYDVLKAIRTGDEVVATAQWNALPNYVGDNRILPIIDVSGSMGCAAGGSGSVSCMDVAISIGMYLATHNTGDFNGLFMSFSQNPTISKMKGTLRQMEAQVRGAEWGYNTNLERAMRVLLAHCKQNQVKKVDLPEYLMIMSDMQFDQATGGMSVTAMDMIRAEFAAAGYDVPKVVFWNINAHGNTPATFNEAGVALVSGFSPAIVRSVLAAKTFTPYDVMMETIGSERYDVL